MNHVRNIKQQGFTIIELTLAMMFISFLLLGIALTIIQIGAVYNQGSLAKEINQVSRDINDDLDRTISASGSLTLATDYMLRPSATAPAGGRLCLGTYTYVWNYAKAINSANVNVTKYLAGPDGTTPSSPIRLVKVPDPGKLYCAKSGTAFTYPNIRSVDTPNAQELLQAGDRELGIHNFAFISPVPASATDASTGQQIYSLTYTIGTSNIAALDATQSACLAPSIVNADPLYCNVQKFSLVVRAGNGVN
jgi:type II secretory pathway pseudopilin PulG